MARLEEKVDFEHLISIDFGSFGFAVTFCNSGLPEKASMVNDWEGTTLDDNNKHKNLSALLLKKEDLSVEAYGFAAQHKYAKYIQKECDNLLKSEKLKSIEDISEEKMDKIYDKSPYILFQHFKPHLNKTGDKLNKDSKVKSTNGKYELSILLLFEKFLKCIMDHSIIEYEKYRDLHEGIKIKLDQKTILFLITAPSTWDDSCYAVLKNCANNAGMKNVEISLEPTCALFDIIYNNEDINSKLIKDKNFLILDCGGGTTDASCMTRNADLSLANVRSKTGIDTGSLFIDHSFEQLLIDILGEEIIKHIKLKMENVWTEFMIMFWRGKHDMKLSDRACLVAMPRQIAKELKRYFGNYETVANKFANYVINGKKENVLFDTDLNIEIKSEAWNYLYFNTINRIGEFVYNILDSDEMYTCEDIILVGGFAQSEFLCHFLKESFKEKGIVLHVPKRSHLCVVKGAPLWYVKQNRIKRYVMHTTYGLKCDEVVDISRNPKSIMYCIQDSTSSTGYIFKDKFDCIIYKGDRYGGDEKREKFFTIPPGVTKVLIDLYAIDKESGCKSIHDAGCCVVSTYTMELAKPLDVKTRLKITISLRETNMLIQMINPTTGRPDFLAIPIKKHIE